MGKYNFKKNEEENYLVQVFVKNVQCEGIQNKIDLHTGFTHLVVGDKNEVFELF